MQHGESTSELPRERRAYVLRLLHSLTGLVPLGVFLGVHLSTNAHALYGQQAFEDRLADSVRPPWLPVAELLGLGIPLVYHALYGLYRVLRTRPNVLGYPLGQNWAYLGQRVTGLGLLLFLGWHLWDYRLAVALGRMTRSDYFPELCERLSSTGWLGIPWHAIGYLLALSAASFHLSHGLSSFCFSWGVVASRRALARVAGGAGIVGVGLFIVGATTLLYYATGSRWAVEPPEELLTGTSCRDHARIRAIGLERARSGSASASQAGHSSQTGGP